jgi:hypothetical protein
MSILSRIDRALWEIGQWKNAPANAVQPLHSAIGFGAMLAGVRLGANPLYMAGGITAATFLIESVFDAIWEPDPFFDGGLEDWTMYCVGLAAAIALLAATKGI